MSLTILYCDDDTCRLHAWFVIQWTAMMRTFSFGTPETWSSHCAHQVQGEGCGRSNGIQSMAMQCWQPACTMVSTFSISFLAKVRKLSMFLFKKCTLSAHASIANLCWLTCNKVVVIKIILVITFVNFCQVEVSVSNTAWIIGVADITNCKLVNKNSPRLLFCFHFLSLKEIFEVQDY